MGISRPEWKRIARGLAKEVAEALDERDEAREQRDAAQLALEQEITREAPIMVTEGAAEAIVEIRDLYAKDGTDEALLRCALLEIREARRLTPRRAAIAMQSDALDAALQRAAGLEESVEIAKQAMHDAQRELRDRSEEGRLQVARLVEEKDEARRLTREWEAKARDAGERLEERRVEVERLEEYVSQVEGEVYRLRGVVEAIAKGTEHVVAITAQQAEEEIWRAAAEATIASGCHPEFPEVADRAVEEFRRRFREGDVVDVIEPLRDRLETSEEDPAQRVDETDDFWLRRRGWSSVGGALDEWQREGPAGFGVLRQFGTAVVAAFQRLEDVRAAEIGSLPVLSYGQEFILEWKGSHRTRLFVHSYSWAVETGATTITCRSTPVGAPVQDAS